MTEFDPLEYPEAVAQLLEPPRVQVLGPGTPNRSARDALHALDVERLGGGREVRDGEMARACISALWLYHDFLDESHTISQDLPSATGSYWHGIMHRREPDWSNAKYWFRRVGDHPIFGPLAEAADVLAGEAGADAELLTSGGGWDPYGFIDLCQAAATGRSDAVDLCQSIQSAEWQLLFGYCYARAFA